MGLIFNFKDDLFAPIGTKVKEAAQAVAEPWLPPEPDPWQEPLNLEGVWDEPIPMPEWAPPPIEEFPMMGGGFDGLMTPEFQFDQGIDESEWNSAQGGWPGLFEPPTADPSLFGAPPTPISWGEEWGAPPPIPDASFGGFDGAFTDPSFSDELAMSQMASGADPMADVWNMQQSMAPEDFGPETMYQYAPQLPPSIAPEGFGPITMWEQAPQLGTKLGLAQALDWTSPSAPPVETPQFDFSMPFDWTSPTVLPPEQYSLNMDLSTPFVYPSPETGHPVISPWRMNVGDDSYYEIDSGVRAPVYSDDTWTGEPVMLSDWSQQVGPNAYRELGSASGGLPFDEVWDGYNRVMDGFAETGLDLTPAAIDTFSGQAFSDALGGGGFGGFVEDYVRDSNPLSRVVGIGSDIAEGQGWFKPGTGYDDAAGSAENLIASKGNLWDFAGQQQDDLQERPLLEQLFGQIVYDPTNIIGGGFISKADNAPDWLRAADKGLDAIQSAPFRTLGLGRFGDDAAAAAGHALAGEAGEVPAKVAARMAFPAVGGGIGYATGDTEEERKERAAIGAMLGGAWGNADLLGKGYGAGLRLLPGGEKFRMGIDPIASRPHMWNEPEYLMPIPEIKTDEKFGLVDKATGLIRKIKGDVQDVPVVRDAGMVMNLLHGKALAVTNELTGTLMQTLDDAAIRIEPDTGRALTRDGRFMPVYGENASTFEAADWSDVAEQWWKYKDAGYIDDAQVDALRRVDAELGRIRKQQIEMKINQPKPRPLWNHNAPEGVTSLYFPRGVPETQNAPLKPLKGERTDSVRIFGREPGTSKEARFETAGQNIVENNQRYPALDVRLSKYITEELDEIINRGVLKQIVDVPVGVSAKGFDGTDRPLTLGDLLFEDKDQLAKVQAELRPLEKTARDSLAKAKIYGRSINIGQHTVDRLEKTIKEASAPFGDVNPRTVSAATTVIREEISTAMDDALAVLDTADDLYRNAWKEADAVRRAQIRQSPDIKAEAKKIRAQIREAKRALDANDAAMKAAPDVSLDTPGLPSNELIILEAAKDALEGSLRLRDDFLKATPLSFPEGAATDLKRAEALGAFGKKMATTGKKKWINAAEEIGAINRSLGKVEAVQKEIAAQTAAGKVQAARQEYWIKKVMDAVDEMEPLQAEKATLKEVEKFVKAARQAVKDDGVTQRVNIAGYLNLDLPENIATTLNRGLKQFNKPDKGIPILHQANQITRPFMTAMDASFIGMMNAFDDPATFVRGAKQGVEAMLPKIGRTPEAIEKANVDRWNSMLAAHDLPSMETLIGRYNLQIGTSELSLGAAAKDSFIAAVKEGRGIDAYSNLPGIKQSGQGFTVAGNTFRAEHAVKGLIDARIRNGAPLTGDTINSIVTAANSVGGRANRQLGESILGVKGPLGRTKLADLWFAGRHYQSWFDLLGNAVLNGNMEGDLARATAIRLAAGGMVTTAMLNESLGQPTEWNPIKDGRVNPNWMRVRLLGYDISPFGTYDSLAKTVLASVMSPEDSPGMVKDFFRSRLAPGAALLADKLTDSGTLAESNNVKDVLGYLNPTPLSIRNFAADVIDTDWDDPRSVAESLFGVGLAITGLKSSPMSPTEKLVEAANKAYEDMDYGDDFSSADTRFLKSLGMGDITNDPVLFAQYKKDHPDEVPEPRSEASKAYHAAKADRDDELARIDRDFRAGKFNLKQYNELVKDTQAEFRGETKNIEFGDGADAKEGTLDAFVDGYFDIFEEVKSGSGEVDWDKFDVEYQKLLKEYGKTSTKREALDAYLDEYLLKDAPKALRAQKQAYNEMDELGVFDMEKFKLNVLTTEQAQEYAAAVREEVELMYSKVQKENPKVERPPFDSVAKKFLKEEYGLAPLEIGDVMTVNKGKPRWSPEYRAIREAHPELFVWFDQDATWSVIQAKQP